MTLVVFSAVSVWDYFFFLSVDVLCFAFVMKLKSSQHLLLYHAFIRGQQAFSLSVDLDGVYRSAGMSRASCNQAQGKWLIPLVMTPARQAQQFSSADTDQ